MVRQELRSKIGQPDGGPVAWQEGAWAMGAGKGLIGGVWVSPNVYAWVVAVVTVLTLPTSCSSALCAPALAQDDTGESASYPNGDGAPDSRAAGAQGEVTPPFTTTDSARTGQEIPRQEEADALQSVDKEGATPSSDEEPSASDLISTEGEKWSRRLEGLLADMRTLDAEVEDADVLYGEISSALRMRRLELRDALQRAGGITAAFQGIEVEDTSDLDAINDLYATVRDLHAVRIELLQHVSSDLYDRATGTGQAGMRELRGELSQLIMYGEVQALLLPRIASVWPTQLKQAPLPLAERVLVVIIAVLLFRQWRRWAPGFLRRTRESLLQARPQKEIKLRSARLIWYFDQVRSPLEWLVLLNVFFKAVEFGELQDLEKALSSVAHWLLLAWFAVALINSIVARGVAGLSGEIATLRLRSLLLIAAWLVLLGLGLDLAETYLGQGTVYAWIWFLFKLLALPLLLLLILMWRSEVLQRLSREPQLPAWVGNVVQNRRGMKSIGGAAIGGTYLIARNLQNAFLRSTSDLEWGRRFQATLYQRELARDANREDRVDGRPVDQAIRHRIIEGDGTILEEVYEKELLRLSHLIEEDNVGLAAVVGERGAGKSTFLKRIGAQFKDQAVVFDCPYGGYEAFETALFNVLGVAGSDAWPEGVRDRLEKSGTDVIAIDNFHRFPRPVKNGFDDMDRLADFVRGLDVRVLWIMAFDSASWQYIRRTRADRIILLEEMHLPPWTEDQIGKLLELRTTAVGIMPNFGELILPFQLDSVDLQTAAEQNRAAFRRLIWHTADGNPAIALRLWSKSLVVTDSGEYMVRLAEQQPTKELEGLSLIGLLVLRVIAQFGRATDEEIVENLRFSRSEVRNAIAVALRKGWVERVENRYRITWNWYRTIITVLARRNLLSRLTRGGLI